MKPKGTQPCNAEPQVDLREAPDNGIWIQLVEPAATAEVQCVSYCNVCLSDRKRSSMWQDHFGKAASTDHCHIIRIAQAIRKAIN